MTIKSSGLLKASEINVELGRSANAAFSLTGNEERELADVPTGVIKFSDFYGKSAFGTHELDVSYLSAVGTPTYGVGGVFNFDPLAVSEIDPNTFTGNPSGSFSIAMLRLYKFADFFTLKLRASDGVDAATVNRMLYVQIQADGFWWPISKYHASSNVEFETSLAGTSHSDYTYWSNNTGMQLVNITDETPDGVQSYVITGGTDGGNESGYKEASYGSLNATSVSIGGTSYIIVEAFFDAASQISRLKLKRNSSGDPFPSKSSFSYFHGNGVTVNTSLASFSTNVSDMTTGTCTWDWDKNDAALPDVPRWSSVNTRDFCFID